MDSSINRISVIVPQNPFTRNSASGRHCLSAIDVERLMEWWPGDPHQPQKRSEKVKSIQRSLDWKRVVQIAAYLLQQEIVDAPEKLIKYFEPIYEPRKNEPGRQWPAKIGNIIRYERSVYPTFSNILVHVNGAKINRITIPPEYKDLKPSNIVQTSNAEGAAYLEFDDTNPGFSLSIIDGQHRINGAYLAIKILQETDPSQKWQIPAEVFLDLDEIGKAPKNQAQIFIDVNFYQKRVDRSLVADLFPTARGSRDSLDLKERAQDIGRKLMLETGPLVGMIQIPGIKFGVKDVISLSTLDNAIENELAILEQQGVEGLEIQTAFFGQALEAWTEASGRFERKTKSATKQAELDPENVAYQGRILVSVIDLTPAMLYTLKKKGIQYVSDKAQDVLTSMFKDIATKANLLPKGQFISKSQFQQKGFVGSGGISRFRNSLWAAFDAKSKMTGIKPNRMAELAATARAKVDKYLNVGQDA